MPWLEPPAGYVLLCARAPAPAPRPGCGARQGSNLAQQNAGAKVCARMHALKTMLLRAQVPARLEQGDLFILAATMFSVGLRQFFANCLVNN